MFFEFVNTEFVGGFYKVISELFPINVRVGDFLAAGGDDAEFFEAESNPLTEFFWGESFRHGDHEAGGGTGHVESGGQLDFVDADFFNSEQELASAGR